MSDEERGKIHEIAKKERIAKPSHEGTKREEGKRRGGARYKYPTE